MKLQVQVCNFVSTEQRLTIPDTHTENTIKPNVLEHCPLELTHWMILIPYSFHISTNVPQEELG